MTGSPWIVLLDSVPEFARQEVLIPANPRIRFDEIVRPAEPQCLSFQPTPMTA